MPVLTIASSKGGPGKTTVCQVLAAALAGELRVVALDADPTQALSRWATKTYEGPLEVMAEPDETRLAHLIAGKAESCDVVLVDTAGFGNRAARACPVRTEAGKTIRLVEGMARAARRDIPARVLLNRVRRTTLARHAAAEIETAGLLRLTATLSDLVAYGEMTYSGRLPPVGQSAAEIAALVDELRKIGWIPEHALQSHVGA